MNRALVVETCCEEKINANLLSKSQLLPAEVRETEQTTLNLNTKQKIQIIPVRGEMFLPVNVMKKFYG